MAMIKQLAERITKEVHKVVVGGEETIDLLLTGLFAGGTCSGRCSRGRENGLG